LRVWWRRDHRPAAAAAAAADPGPGHEDSSRGCTMYPFLFGPPICLECSYSWMTRPAIGLSKRLFSPARVDQVQMTPFLCNPTFPQPTPLWSGLLSRQRIMQALAWPDTSPI
jgi:hypothetical protein